MFLLKFHSGTQTVKVISGLQLPVTWANHILQVKAVTILNWWKPSQYSAVSCCYKILHFIGYRQTPHKYFGRSQLYICYSNSLNYISSIVTILTKLCCPYFVLRLLINIFVIFGNHLYLWGGETCQKKYAFKGWGHPKNLLCSVGETFYQNALSCTK